MIGRDVISDKWYQCYGLRCARIDLEDSSILLGKWPQIICSDSSWAPEPEPPGSLLPLDWMADIDFKCNGLLNADFSIGFLWAAAHLSGSDVWFGVEGTDVVCPAGCWMEDTSLGRSKVRPVKNLSVSVTVAVITGHTLLLPEQTLSFC